MKKSELFDLINAQCKDLAVLAERIRVLEEKRFAPLVQVVAVRASVETFKDETRKKLKEIADNVDNLYTHNLAVPLPNEKVEPQPLKLWQHSETGRMVWSREPGDRWFEIPTMYEQDLPEMTASDYSDWFENSMVVDGVRMGPEIQTQFDDLEVVLVPRS